MRSMKRISLLTVFAFLLLTIAVSANEGAILDPNLPESWMHAPRTASEWGITSFNEAPMLAERVKAGELPPVEERLPVDPPVIEPYGEIGVYGGTAETWGTELDWWGEGWLFNHFGLWARALPDGTGNVPELVKGWEYAEDNMSMIVYMREGLRWSDGAPYTADDVMFFWEYVEGNTELTPTPYIGRDVANIEKIDDYTLKITFHQPTPHFHGAFSYTTNWWATRYPAHYMKQFHIDFQDPEYLQELAEEHGFDNWLAHYYARGDVYPSQQFTDLPVLGPWMVKERTATGRIYERNPYFYAVDTEGNQLPYIDQLEVKIMTDREVAVLDAMQGGLDIAGFILSPAEFGMYIQNQDRGNYRVLAWRSGNSSEVTYAFNLNNKDEKKRELFNDVRFRQAMSLAINRDEINHFVYQGMGEPCQVTVDPNTSFFKPEWAASYAEYDPAKARELLESIGLKKGADGYYTFPDGSPLVIQLHVPSGSETGSAGFDEVNELVADYWKEVGINTDYRIISRDLSGIRTTAGEHDVMAWHTDRMQELRAYLPGLTQFELTGNAMRFANEWGYWNNYQTWLKSGRTDGEPGRKGEEPPQYVKDFLELKDAWYKAQSDEEYVEYGQKVFDFYAENLWLIGTVARSLRPIIVTNTLNNIPEVLPFGDDTSFWRLAKPEQWFFSK